jgi:hypothetical protein
MFVEDMSRNKGFSRFEYHMFYSLYPFVSYLYLLTLSHINKSLKNVVAVCARNHSAQDRGKYKAVMNTLIIFGSHKERGISSVAEQLLTSKQGLCFSSYLTFI